MKLGLDNIGTLLCALGNPETKYTKVQVAGTNGKGSVCAFLDAICRAANIRTGVFTSPHLVSITERVRIGGVDISEPDFATIASRVREKAEKLLVNGELQYCPTFFEQVTAIALVAFAEAGVNLAILETGLGGRLDATTAANANIAAITSIDLDHQEHLGETIEEIAGEKAAIINAGSKVVIGDQQPRVMNVLLQRCVQFGIIPRAATPADLYEAGISMLGMVGRHQRENAAVAYAIADLLRNDLDITKHNIAEGLMAARHPGRLEFQDNFLFDGAHNPAGAAALRAFLDEFVSQPITMVFGAMHGKDIVAIATKLFPRADKLVLTQPSNSRSMTAAALAGFVDREYEPEHLFLTANVHDALTVARSVTPSDGLILITGSLYLIGEAKKVISAVNGSV